MRNTIKDLKMYPLLYEAAILNTKQHLSRNENNNIDLDVIINKSLVNAFSWARSPEGTSFWSDVFNGYFDRVAHYYPHLFEVDIAKIKEEAIAKMRKTKITLI